MILTVTEYAAAQDQLTRLESWLERLKQDQPLPDNGLIRSSIRQPRTIIDETFGRLVFKVLNGKNRIGRHMENGNCRIAVPPWVSFLRVRQAFQWADNAWRTRTGFTHGSRPNMRTGLCHPHSMSRIALVQPRNSVKNHKN